MMFELMKVFEIASNEENKYLRFIYQKYARYKLRHSFFKKFSIKNIHFNDLFLKEFCQFYNCIDSSIVFNEKYPYIGHINIDIELLYIYYYDYRIKFTHTGRGEYNIEIIDANKMNTIRLFKSETSLNNFFIKEIILMGIYNICVSYIYGKESDLYIDDKRYIKMLKEYF